MLGVRALRLRLWWDGAFWVIPLLGVVAAWLLVAQSEAIDEVIVADGVQGPLAPGAALTLLAAVGGGMVTFTGFVFSVVLLMLQFGSSEYSPRTVSYFLQSRILQWVLAVFLTTILFSFLTMLDVGSGSRAEFVPVTSVGLAVLLLLLSLVGFLTLLHVVGNRVRVDVVLTDIGRQSRRALRSRFAAVTAPAARPLESVPEPTEEEVAIRFDRRPGQVVAVNTARLVRLARQHQCRILLTIRTGDAVSRGSTIAWVDTDTLSDRVVSACLLVDDERSLRYDPLYALRLLTDISLRALSPGINDPTTAVRSLDEVEGVLRAASTVPMGPTEVEAGTGRVVLRTPTWSDVVDLALLEVIEAGAGQPQVTRRLAALLADLLADLPADRRDALSRYSLRLDGVVPLEGEHRHRALARDRQGIGGSG